MSKPDIRLNDLLSRGKQGSRETKLMNVKVPTSLLGRIDDAAKTLGATKTELVIAVLNEGLEKAEENLKGFKALPKPVVPKDRQCKAKGCERERVAKGLCATHYQVMRRIGK